MMTRWTPVVVLAAALVAAISLPMQAQDGEMVPPFGGAEDVAYAEAVWAAMDGYRDWKLHTDVYKGQSPHGSYLRLFSTFITVDGGTHPIIVKENYGGQGVSAEAATADPDQWLKAVTIMLQREDGYDSDNDNWFWVKFSPSGEILKNPKDMLLAGRVAKGMPKGCIACHTQAGGGDYLFSNDE